MIFTNPKSWVRMFFFVYLSCGHNGNFITVVKKLVQNHGKSRGLAFEHGLIELTTGSTGERESHFPLQLAGFSGGQPRLSSPAVMKGIICRARK